METQSATPMLLRPLAAALLLTCGTPQAALLCEAAPCRVEMEFAVGGAIEAPAGATISVGNGGLLDLGSGGSIDYGSGGSAEPATTGSAVPDLSSGGRIVLGPGGGIHFGSGGRLLGGDAAQVETPDDGTMEFRTPSRVEIGSDTVVNVGPLLRFGSVRVEAKRIDGRPAPFRFGGAPDSEFVLRTTDTAWIERLDESGSVFMTAEESIKVDAGRVGTPDDGAGGTSGSDSGVVLTESPGGGYGSGVIMTASDITIYNGTSEPTISGGTLMLPGTIAVDPTAPGTVELVDDGQGGGAFPRLLLAILAALGFARRSRR